MQINLNLILFASYLLFLGYKISYTHYTIKTKEDVLQVIYGGLVVLFFWAVDQFGIQTDTLIPEGIAGVAVVILLVTVYIGIGWGNVEVLLMFAKRGQKITEERIEKIGTKETDEAIITKEEKTTITETVEPKN